MDGLNILINIVTDLSKDKQGVVIAIPLPEDDNNEIQENVFSQLGLADLKSGWSQYSNKYF